MSNEKATAEALNKLRTENHDLRDRNTTAASELAKANQEWVRAQAEAADAKEIAEDLSLQLAEARALLASQTPATPDDEMGEIMEQNGLAIRSAIQDRMDQLAPNGFDTLPTNVQLMLTLVCQQIAACQTVIAELVAPAESDDGESGE